MKLLATIALVVLVGGAGRAHSQSVEGNSDDFTCNHGEAGARVTMEACSRLRNGQGQPPGPSPEFIRGQNERSIFEAWFKGLSGEYLAGASFWTSNRSIRDHAPCDGQGSPSTGSYWTSGCVAAQWKLAASDTLRHSSPEYRLGWNSFTAVPDSSQPASGDAQPENPSGSATNSAHNDAAMPDQSTPTDTHVATTYAGYAAPRNRPAGGSLPWTIALLLAAAAVIGGAVYLAIKGGQDPEDQLRTLLVSGEDVKFIVVQNRLHALLHRRNLAAATTGRFISLRRPLFGGYDMFDMRWQDIKDVKLTVGMISSTISLSFSNNLSDTSMYEGDTRRINSSGLQTGPAQALYRECQLQEQSWREKRRVRSIEEMRAKAGGVQIATGVYPPAIGATADAPSSLLTAASIGREDIAGRLRQAKELQAQGLITDTEYESMKARIIASM
jgi:hypothetical protein